MEWFCNKCNMVYESKMGQCCKVKSEQFDLGKHGRKLISSSNTWISISKIIEEKWKNDPIFKEVEAEYVKDGCYSAAIIFNAFVERLKIITDN